MMKKLFLGLLLGATALTNLAAQGDSPPPPPPMEMLEDTTPDSMPATAMLAQMRLLRVQIDALTAMIGDEGDRQFNDAESGQAVYDSLLQFSNELDDLSYILAEAIPFDEKIVEETGPTEDSTAVALDEEEYVTDEDVTNVKPRSKSWKPTQQFGFGVGSWRYTSENANNLTPNIGKSWYFEIASGAEYRLGGEKSPMALGLGFGFVSQTYNLGDETISVISDNALLVTTVPGEVKKSTFSQSQIYTPVTLVANLGSKTKIFAGGYAAYAFSAKTKASTTYELFGSAKKQETISRNYHINQFQYGALAGVTYSFVSAVFKYQAAELFTAEGISDAHPWSVGLYLNMPRK